MRNISLKEDFENRVAINDLNEPTTIKSAIIVELSRHYTQDETELQEILSKLGDVMFDLRTLNVELHNGPMYEITDILDVSNEELANVIKNVLVSMPKNTFESIVATGKVKMFEHFFKG